MAEGGFFPWKVQKIQAVPTFDYSKLALPLEEPPKGLHWVRDSTTKEWHLVTDEEEKKSSYTTVFNPPTNLDSNNSVEGSDNRNQEPIVSIAVEVDTAIPIDSTAHIVDVDQVNCDNVIYHKVQSTDTIQGLCIRYKVTPTQLRQWNRFTGSNLLLAPDILIIKVDVDPSPIVSSSSKGYYQNEKNRKIQQFLLLLENKTGIPYNASHKLSFSPKEAEAYIDMYDGNIQEATEAAIHDMAWERQK